MRTHAKNPAIIAVLGSSMLAAPACTPGIFRETSAPIVEKKERVLSPEAAAERIEQRVLEEGVIPIGPELQRAIVNPFRRGAALPPQDQAALESLAFGALQLASGDRSYEAGALKEMVDHPVRVSAAQMAGALEKIYEVGDPLEQRGGPISGVVFEDPDFSHRLSTASPLFESLARFQSIQTAQGAELGSVREMLLGLRYYPRGYSLAETESQPLDTQDLLALQRFQRSKSLPLQHNKKSPISPQTLTELVGNYLGARLP